MNKLIPPGDIWMLQVKRYWALFHEKLDFSV